MPRLLDPAAPLGPVHVALLLASVLWVVALLPGAQPTAPGTPFRPCLNPAATTPTGSPLTEVACGGGPGAGGRLSGAPRLLFGLPLDLNEAGRVALDSLPGIGPRRAAAIVEERCVQPFEDLSGLERVPGIGPVTVNRLRGWAVAHSEPDCTGPPVEHQGGFGAEASGRLDPLAVS